MSNFTLLFVSVVLGATGQFLFRLGMKSYGQVNIDGVFRHLFNIVTRPVIFLGFILFGLSSILWLSVISKSQLSYAYPMVSMSYILTLILSSLFLNEQINTYKIVGTIFIISGVIFISRS